MLELGLLRAPCFGLRPRLLRRRTGRPPDLLQTAASDTNPGIATYGFRPPANPGIATHGLLDLSLIHI